MEPAAVAAVRQKMRDFGFVPKCWFMGSQSPGAERWMMLYAHKFGRSSQRYFIGVYSGTGELLRHEYPSDLAARKDFELRAEQWAAGGGQ